MNRPHSAYLHWTPWLLLAACLLAMFEAAPVLGFFNLAEHALLLAWRKFISTLAWIFFAAVINQLMRRWFWDGLISRMLGHPVPGVMKEISALLVYLVSLGAIASAVFDQPITGFFAALGAFGVVIGFGLRDLFADIFTGLAINIDRTFAIGDWVQINEGTEDPTVAKIREIGWRSTILTTEEQTTVVVPNGMLGRERVVNISQPIEPTRYELTLTVEFSVPAERVRRVLLAALKAVSDTPGFDLTHEPAVLVSDASSLGVEYLMRYWILPWHPLSPTSARDQVMTRALRYLRIAGISLAYPKTDVYHAQLPERQVEGHSAAGEITLLSQIKLFKPLNQDELESIVQNLERHKFKPGAVLVQMGEEGDSLFVLIEGLLDVEVESSSRQIQRVARIEPGQCFGEMSLLTGERRSATVRSVVPSVVYEIGRQSLRDIMDHRPELANKLSRILAERQLVTQQVLERTTNDEVGAALDSFARQLLSRMREFLGQKS